MAPLVFMPSGSGTLVGHAPSDRVIGHTIARALSALKPRSVRMNAGRVPPCSVPRIGSKSTQTMSPASTTRRSVMVVEAFRASIRTPIDRLGLVLRTEPFHLVEDTLERDLSRAERIQHAFTV